jgi:thioester reductase-like protein
MRGMPTNRAVLLTGATGLLGRYLLRDLLHSGQRVAVLARDSADATAAQRIAELHAWCAETLGRSLPAPVVLAGDLNLAHAGLDGADRRWLAQHADRVLHAAASLSFRQTPDGEPWRTNVEGTRRLLELGLPRWHYVSTAYVCGRRGGVIRETDCDPAAPFQNVYEQSKAGAEELVRSVHATIYRPAVIIGDSRTGYTSSYVGLYRFLEMGARLARGRSLRLPLSGAETVSLVPVDWVARAIVALMERQGDIFHLVSPEPVPARLIHAAGVAELGLDGVRLVGRDEGGALDDFERQFLDGLREYWPYLDHPATFCAANTTRALPHLPPPRVDRALLQRLIRFAVADRWGRPVGQAFLPAALWRARMPAPGTERCASYFEHTFPQQAQASNLARAIGLDILVAFDITGPGGGQWSCRWVRGELVEVRRGMAAGPAVTYRTDGATFAAIIDRQQSPQEAFFAERITMEGDLETALKLVVLFDQFLRERTEVPDAAPV